MHYDRDSFNWESLFNGIHGGKCILFLGPDLPWILPDGERRLPRRLLAERLLRKLDGDGRDLDLGNPGKIAQRFRRKQDDVDLEAVIRSWHEGLKSQRSTLHDTLSTLPFLRIVTSGQDPLMETALRHRGKNPKVDFYHHHGEDRGLLPEPRVDAPILYHLYGHVREPRSVVLAETQLLEFLTALISQNPPPPKNLKRAFQRTRRFLFLGFGLHQWYLRILLHALEVLKKSRTLAVESLDGDLETSEKNTILFYQENFQVDVLDTDIAQFVEDLAGRFHERYPDPAAAADAAQIVAESPRARAMVFMCYCKEDREHAVEIRDFLGKKNVHAWLPDDEILPGDPQEQKIEAFIRSTADGFVVLNSESLAGRVKEREETHVFTQIDEAQKRQRKLPEQAGFILPVTINDVPLISEFSGLHSVEHGSEEGMRKLVRAIKRLAREH